MLVTTLLLMVMVPAQGNEAEELFKKMEEKVHKARTIQYESDSALEGKQGNQRGSMGTKLMFAEGNKTNFTFNISDGGKKQTMQSISDGKRQKNGKDDKFAKAEETPKHLTAGIATLLTRVGGMGGLLFAAPEEENPLKADKLDKDKLARLSDFKLGKKEKIGDVEAQSITYSAKMGNIKLLVSVWIDAKTNLPVKRVFETGEGAQTMKVTETIKSIKLDEKVDDKLFEVKD